MNIDCNPVQKVINNIDRNERELKGLMNHPYLRSYVLSKDVHIDIRFHVWSKYCAKIHLEDPPGKDEFFPIGKIYNLLPNTYLSQDCYDWKFFLQVYTDWFAMTEVAPIVFEDCESLSELKELLILHNFGSFKT